MVGVLRADGTSKVRRRQRLMAAAPTPRGIAALPPRGWSRGNRAALRQWLAARAQRAAADDVAAVFDFDNTVIAGDVGDATLRAQLDGLWLRQSPAAFAGLLPAPLGATAEALADDVMVAYHALWTAGMGRGGSGLGGAAHLDLRVKLGLLYTAMKATPGVGVRTAYAWVAGLLSGLSAAEVGTLARQAWAAGAALPPSVATWYPATAGRAGGGGLSFRRGLSLQPEMADLIAALGAAAVPCYIVTASHEEVVRAVVAELALGVPAGHVIGMRPDEPDAPITYREGKVAAIAQQVRRTPVLVAGDANTDFEMLTHFDGTEIRLVINRNAGEPLASLYPLARARARPGTPRTLLQGRDDNTGRFWPRRETRALGAQAARPLPARARPAAPGTARGAR